MQQPQELNEQCQNCTLNVAHCNGTPNGKCKEQIKPKTQPQQKLRTPQPNNIIQEIAQDTAKFLNSLTPQNHSTASPHKPTTLNYLAATLTLIIWIAASAWLLQNCAPTTTLTIAGIAAFWLPFIVAFKLMLEGALD